MKMCSCKSQFGRLILRKIIKILVTRCQILRLKYAPNSISALGIEHAVSSPEGSGPAPDPSGELTARARSPNPLAEFNGVYF